MKFTSAIDLLKLSVKGFVPESSATAPTSPVEGQGWHDSAAQRWKVYLATGWRVLVDERRSIATGTGLLGGGDLSADRTHSVDFAADGGGTASQAVRGTDSRLTNGRAPTGTAGGDLTGTYPNPQIAAGVIVDGDVNAANKDGAVAVPSMRTIGTGALQAMAGNKQLNQLPVGADVNLGTYKITNLGTPTADTDASTKGYVDSRVQGADWKDSVTVVRGPGDGNIALPPGGTTLQIDSVTLANGDRVLLAGQTNPAQNGIYVVGGVGSAVTLTRAPDADGGTELSASSAVFVEQGTINGDTGWTITSNGPITIGTTAMTWGQFTGVGDLIGGAGLVKTGKQLDITATDGTIVVGADSIGVGLVPVAKGGTGATTPGQGRYGLNAAAVDPIFLPALTAGVWTTISSFTGIDWYEAVPAFFDASTQERLGIDERILGGAGTAVYQVRSDIAWAANSIMARVASAPTATT